MGKIKNCLFSFLLFSFGFLIWTYKMLITSNIPINVSFKEFIATLSLIFIYTIITYFYIRKIKNNLLLLNFILLSILLVFWLGNLSTSIIYKYNIYDTILNFLGFISIVINIIKLLSYKKK